MQNFRNYYEILAIPQEATEEEIKKSFRRLARQYHPDLNPNNKAAEERFKVISEAYEVLSDTEKRAKYDQFSRFWQQAGFQATVSPQSPAGWQRVDRTTSSEVDYSQFPDFNTFVDELLGHNPPPRPIAKRPGNETVRNFSSGDAPRTEFGVSPKETLRVGEACPSDKRNFSSGDAPRTELQDSAPRSSSSNRSSLQDFKPGTSKKAYTVVTHLKAPPRKDIEARLEVPLEKAYSGGRERVRLEDGRSLEVEMPGGMVTGQRIRLRGQGISGGDLYLLVQVPKHPCFKLEGSEIYTEIIITPTQAVLGHPIEVPTLDGPVKMYIPPGLRSGQKLRLADKGYPTPKGDRGDQIVEVQIAAPQNLTPEERALYEKLYELEQVRSHQTLNRLN
jgi:curved DNA-binding protein